MPASFSNGDSDGSSGTVTISDIVAEYDEIDTPETPAHELWLGANWINDQLDIGLPEGGLTGKDQEVMVVEEAKQGGYIEIHHTHAEAIPAKIKGIIPQTHCKIAGSESRFHSEKNIVHTIIWIVPESLVDTWKQPEASFDQYESFDQRFDDDVGVGELGEEDGVESDEDSQDKESKSTSSNSDYSQQSTIRDGDRFRETNHFYKGMMYIMGGCRS